MATMGIRVEPVGRTGTRQLGTAAVRHLRVTTIVVVVIYMYLLLLRYRSPVGDHRHP